MRAIRRVRIVVAADEVSGRLLVDVLKRMQVPQVTLVDSTEEARSLCTEGGADACLVVMRNFQIEEPLICAAENPAPAVSSILLADVVTPYVARAARRSGYAGVAARAISPRLLYRLIGGALQKARRAHLPMQVRGNRPISTRLRRQSALRIGFFGASPVPATGYGKIKLHS